MTVTEEVQAILVASAVTGLVPADEIRVPGAWQNLAAPYIVHFPVGVRPSHTHDGGLAPLRQWDYYQVSIFASDYGTGEDIAVEVRAALDGVHEIGSPVTDGVHIFWDGGWYVGKETDTGLHHFALNFQIAEAL